MYRWAPITLLVRNRAPKEGRVASQGELEYLKTRFGSWAEPMPALLAATDPERRPPQ